MNICSPIHILLLIFTVAGLLAGRPDWKATAQSSHSGLTDLKAGLHITVQDSQRNLPIPAARVSLPDINLQTDTDESGLASWEDIALTSSTVPVTITISAMGYGDWTIANVILAANDTLILTPKLSTHPVLFRFPSLEKYALTNRVSTTENCRKGPCERSDQSKQVLFPGGQLSGGWAYPQSNRDNAQKIDVSIGSVSGGSLEQTDFSVPTTIRVRMTGKWECDQNAPYTVETVDFKQYVKHVLPNEWYSFWPRESLKAGAVAVKMYAWYFIDQGGKWDDADVIDNTCDQWYVPFMERTSTNQAVDDTWPWLMTRSGSLFPAFHKDIDACDPPNCIRQSISANLARNGQTWDEILEHFYGDITLTPFALPSAGFALRFHGNPEDGLNANRLVFRIDDPEHPEESFPTDIGGTDFTIDWWMKAISAENTTPPIKCGANDHWIYGNILLDRFRPEQAPGFGISLGGGRLAFGVTARSGRSLTICSDKPVTDGKWHHIAVQRGAADGSLWLYIDGQLAARGDGPKGDLRFTAQSETVYPDREPFLSLGGWRMDPDHRRHPFFNGWIDELRISRVLRYETSFDPIIEPFEEDEATLAIYHFDEGIGTLVVNAMGTAGDGQLLYGGLNLGPEWVVSNLFIPTMKTYLPSVLSR